MDIDIDTSTGVDLDELENILDSFVLPEAFNNEEELELTETAYSLIVELLNAEPMIYIQPYFHEYVILEVTELLTLQLSEAITYDIQDEITSCVEQGMKIFYTEVAPKRSYSKSFIRNNFSLEKQSNFMRIREKINYLQNIPQPEQRTAEWYNFRYKYLTASSIWKAFISESTRNQLIFDKCKPLNIEKYSHTSTDSPMHWGHKYEPVSVQLYELLYQTQVSDFGCIPHRSLNYLAASPDGINTLETSPRYGRMLEIKNIVNREIDGIPKMEYWIQMQLQMEVCNLNECDFLETRFKEYADEEEYLQDERENLKKGIMIQFMVGGQPQYEYAPLNASKDELLEWEEIIMLKHENDMWVKNIYWRLDELSCVLVLRNKFWFKNAIPILDDLWKTIEYEKVYGYQHRSPNKKIKLDKNYVVVKSENSMYQQNSFINLFPEVSIDTEMYDESIISIDTEMYSADNIL
jgi:putative phage-type endonuclease